MAAIALCGLATLATAQDARPQASIDLTVFDAPYNVSFGGRAPSMSQSRDFTVAQYEVLHSALSRAFGNRRGLGKTAVIVYDWLSTVEISLPLTDVWVHEEYHRAQLGRRGIGSFDDVYLFRTNSNAIAVSHVQDADLVRLKAEHPAEWVRTNEAGAEGELAMVRDLETRQFRGLTRGWHLPLYWLAKASTAGYVASSVWAETDDDTEQMNRDEGANVPRRDFTGHDFLAWTYDLHRPNEPYAARGVHPSGVGIDRYIKTADLTAAERDWIRHEGQLQLLNFVDPFLFGLGSLHFSDSVAATASLSHVLTSFGHTIDLQLLGKRNSLAGSAIVHVYQNGARTFPGIEGTLFDVPVNIAQFPIKVTPRAMVWLQPAAQRFDTRDMSAGGLASLRVQPMRTRARALYFELEGKTAGWVMSSPYLGSNVSIRTGLNIPTRR
jgi:hypothetical protein